MESRWLKTFAPEMSPAGTCPELIIQEGGEDLAGHSPSLVQREFRTSPCPPRGDWSHKQMKVRSGDSPVQTLRQHHSPRPRTLDASQERHILQGPGGLPDPYREAIACVHTLKTAKIWGEISISNAKRKLIFIDVCTCACLTLDDAIALQAPLSVGFSRQECWCGLPCPPPGDLPNPGIELASLCLLHWQAGSFH